MTNHRVKIVGSKVEFHSLHRREVSFALLLGSPSWTSRQWRDKLLVQDFLTKKATHFVNGFGLALLPLLDSNQGPFD